MNPSSKIIVFDCDSTLSAIEGIDELARLAGPDTLAQVEQLTNQAMDGEIPLDQVFGRRMELIAPTQSQCDAIGQLYIEKIEPTALSTITTLQQRGWDCLILSGGFAPCIAPLATHLGITQVEAVPLHFHPDGSYHTFGTDYPTTRNGGKPEILQHIRDERQPQELIMIGDGISDLETHTVADRFIAYTGFVARPKVVAQSPESISQLSELTTLLS